MHIYLNDFLQKHFKDLSLIVHKMQTVKQRVGSSSIYRRNANIPKWYSIWVGRNNIGL